MSYLGSKPANTIITSAQISDGVITADDLAAGAVTRSKIGYAGAVLQVVNATLIGFASRSSSTFADTGLTATITPTSSTSKILVMADISGCGSDTNPTALQLRLLRNSTTIVNIEDFAATGSASSYYVGACSTNYLDSPATTSATTYKIQFASRANAAFVYVNVAGSNNYTTSTITLMEIAS